MTRCTNCYLEIQPGNKICPRCHLPIEETTWINWRNALIGLVCLALVGGIAFFVLKH
jgi:uncharacterized protein (UPF0212 family)